MWEMLGIIFEALGLLHAHALFPSDLHPQWSEMTFLFVLGIELRIYACWGSAFPLSYIPNPKVILSKTKFQIILSLLWVYVCAWRVGCACHNVHATSCNIQRTACRSQSSLFLMKVQGW